MVRIVFCMLAVATCAIAQQSTIDLNSYKNAKKYTYSEKAYTVGTHQYKIINIKPVAPGDTTCISAIVIDKRKLLFADLGAEGKPVGLMVPASQPISGGLIVIKASPIEAKTFIMLPTGKLVTLPGSLVIVDTSGTTVYTVWENDEQYRLTVLDYSAMRIVIPTMLITKPDKWYSTDVQFCFTAGKKAVYTVDTFTKSVVKGEEVEAGAKPVSYVLDPAQIDADKCCTAPSF